MNKTAGLGASCTTRRQSFDQHTNFTLLSTDSWAENTLTCTRSIRVRMAKRLKTLRVVQGTAEIADIPKRHYRLSTALAYPPLSELNSVTCLCWMHSLIHFCQFSSHSPFHQSAYWNHQWAQSEVNRLLPRRLLPQFLNSCLLRRKTLPSVHFSLVLFIRGTSP